MSQNIETLWNMQDLILGAVSGNDFGTLLGRLKGTIRSQKQGRKPTFNKNKLHVPWLGKNLGFTLKTKSRKSILAA